MTPDFRRTGASGALLFAAGLAVATGLMFWFGIRATREWQRSTNEAAETRGHEVVTLLGVAFERDMKGGQISVLLPLDDEVIAMGPYDLGDRFARGFARFPYLESFFVWTANGSSPGSTYVFNRADRTPPWDKTRATDDPYPVVFRRDPQALAGVVARARQQASRGTRFAMFEEAIAGEPYQTIAHLIYEGSGVNARLVAVSGFLVNLRWVKAHYFTDFLRQMQGIIGDTSLGVEIRDDEGRTIATVGPPVPEGSRHVRAFQLLFADPALLSDALAPQTRAWTMHVGVASEASRAAAGRGAVRTMALLGLGAFATIIGLGLTVRAARTAANLAAVQSEFVSAVSHEMKTPLSLIKLASDTLANGRYAEPSAIADYGRLMGTEAQHLTRLIDNVLCYARITDTSSGYDFEPLDVAEVAQESVDRFRPQLSALGFEVHINLPLEPAMANADHLMLGQVFDNIIDNAAKYAASGHYLRVQVTNRERAVEIEIADRGEGISAADLPRVFDKFYRRSGTKHRGAGLGLAIVRRIVEDHHGTASISSVPGQGTALVLRFPRVAT